MRFRHTTGMMGNDVPGFLILGFLNSSNAGAATLSAAAGFFNKGFIKDNIDVRKPVVSALVHYFVIKMF